MSYNHAFIDSSGVTTLSTCDIKGVTVLWHNNVNIKTNSFKVQYSGFWAIAKFAHFEWEIPFLKAETVIYRPLAEHGGIAPKSLGRLHENGRVVGMLLEYIEGRRSRKETCACALGRLHALGRGC